MNITGYKTSKTNYANMRKNDIVLYKNKPMLIIDFVNLEDLKETAITMINLNTGELSNVFLKHPIKSTFNLIVPSQGNSNNHYTRGCARKKLMHKNESSTNLRKKNK